MRGICSAFSDRRLRNLLLQLTSYLIWTIPEVFRHFGQVFCRAARFAVEKFCSCNASVASMLNRFSMIKNGATRARVSYRGLQVDNWNPYPQSTSENVRTFNFFPVFLYFFYCFLFIHLFSYLFIIIIHYYYYYMYYYYCLFFCFYYPVLGSGGGKKQTNKKHRIPSASLTVLQFVEAINMKKQI